LRNNNAKSGIITILPDGRGIINSTNDKFEKVFVSKVHLNGAFDQDEVKYTVQRSYHSSFKKAKIIQILKRKKNTFTGRVYNEGKNIFIIVSPNQSKNIKLIKYSRPITDFTVVKIDIVDWNERGPFAHGEINEVIAQPNDPLADHLYVVNKYVINGLLKVDSGFENFDLDGFISDQKDRIDYSLLNTFSIDPDDAQDFDDAISIKFQKDIYELIIHIADVTAFVDEGSSIDHVALQNSNSYYFPEKSYHMLPYELATKYCSLVPNEKRLAVSLYFELTSDGDVVSQQAHLSTIKNKNRMTYGQVNELLSKSENIQKHEDIFLLYEIHKKLKSKRLKEGALNLSGGESTFEFDHQGSPLKIIDKKQSVSHSMVEECMLLANKYAATLLSSKSLPIFRNHDMPSRRAFLKIESLISAFSDKPKNFNDFIGSIRSTKKRGVFSKLILKNLKRAEYSLTNKGHYGLSFDTYIHFTSPIRRYADLHCHSLLKNVLNNQKTPQIGSVDKIIKKINQNEQKAKNAENEYNRLKKIKYIKLNQEKIFSCTIESLSKKYILVNINEANFTATLSTSYLKHDRYRLARNKHALVGQFSNKTYKIGDELKVGINKIDMINQAVHVELSN
jgi:ribonuclease R